MLVLLHVQSVNTGRVSVGDSSDVSAENLSVPTPTERSTNQVTITHTHRNRMHEIFRSERKLQRTAEFLVFLGSRTACHEAKRFLFLVACTPQLRKKMITQPQNLWHTYQRQVVYLGGPHLRASLRVLIIIFTNHICYCDLTSWFYFIYDQNGAPTQGEANPSLDPSHLSRWGYQ